MRGGLRRGLGLLLLTAAAACTQDFSAFRFVDMKPARDLHDPSTARDAGNGDDAGADAKFDAHADPEAEHPRVQPVSEAGAAGTSSEAMRAATAGATGPEPQAQPHDAGGDEDAGPPAMSSLTQQCSASWPDLKTGSSICRYCSCNSCAAPIVDCLGGSDETQRTLCRNVLACALRTHCKDGACYCTGDGCGYPNASGDGPCVAEIEAAAGGKRTRVTELRQLNPPPRDQPYLRAIAAITCLYGSDDASLGPAVMEQCMTSCGR